MSDNKNPKEFYISAFTKFEEKLNGQSKTFLHDIRKDALNKLASINFPTTRDEEWKYTNVSPITKQNYVHAINLDSPKITRDEINQLLFNEFDYHLLVFVNGLFSEELSLI
ncbi:MAG: Fe-S cluster assembly protein SufD, partial [Ignavibacteria bacterium]|nr:Fe-S cluster assembly protein SufD [Ignavibacteria bacterium]